MMLNESGDISDPWDELNPWDKAVLVERTALLHPREDPAVLWREMGPDHRREWIRREREHPIIKTWKVDEDRVVADADPKTGERFRGLSAVRSLRPDSELLRRRTMPEVLDEPSEFEWLIPGLLVSPTYGQVAGEMKTLKSYILQIIQVGLASGSPIFDKFQPPVAGPVVAYVGEGGQAPWTRRISRICSALGVNVRSLDLHPIFDLAPIASETFAKSFRRDLDEIQPALVTLDPLYVYHGAATRASDLHQEGALLNQLSGPCMDSGASLLVVNHFNQTGYGRSLKRITMSGSGEWADSWILVDHREKPDVPSGSFKLTLEVGSRQWGGSIWDLDLEIGRFEEDTGTHDGDIAWTIARAGTSSSDSNRRGKKGADVQTKIREVLADNEWVLTKNELKTAVGGSREVFQNAFEEMVAHGLIYDRKLDHQEGGTTKSRSLWGLVPTIADDDRPRST